MVELREEKDFFRRNPSLYEFRKPRVIEEKKTLTPRDLHPELFYQPEDQNKIKSQLLKQL